MKSMLAVLLSLSAVVAQQPGAKAEPDVQTKVAAAEQTEVFVDVKIVTYRSNEPETGHRALATGVRTFDLEGAGAALRSLRDDASSQVCQAPKVITLDGSAASICIGDDPKSPGIDVRVTPNLLADRRSLTLQIESRITAAGTVSKSTFVALHSGETVVLFHGRSEDGTETLLFVRPDVIKRSPKVGVRRAVR